MNDCTVRVCGNLHAHAYFHIVNCNVCKVVVEFNLYVGIMHMAGADIDLTFQVWV